MPITPQEALQRTIEEKGKAEQKASDLESGQAEREVRMRKEFDLLARNIMEENTERHQKELANSGKKTLEDVLNPMKERFSELQKQMKEFYGSEREQLGQLDKELEKLFKLNQSLQTDDIEGRQIFGRLDVYYHIFLYNQATSAGI